MIYQHRETGLRLVVNIIEHTRNVKSVAGNQDETIVVGKELRTAAGDPVTPVDPGDDGLMVVKVYTAIGEIELIRFED